MTRRLLTVGVLVLSLTVLTRAQASGQVIRSGPSTCQGVALTFDMCPVREGSGYDEALVELLKERHIPATFFLSGRWMTRHDQQVRDLLSVPFFELGTHGQKHAHLPMLSAEEQQVEIRKAALLLHDRYGYASVLFRPPYGEFDDTTVDVVRTLGLRFILWNVVSGDPDPDLSAKQILTSVSSRLRNGAIVVFHGNGKGQYTREVIEALSDHLQKAHLRPVTVTELLDRCGNAISQSTH